MEGRRAAAEPGPGRGILAMLTGLAVGQGKTEIMFAIIAAVLVVLWLLGFFAFHITDAAIHIILIIAIVMVVLHVMRGRRSV